MNIEEIQKKINEFWYEARILDLSCNHFADEMTMLYAKGKVGEGNIQYRFMGCYKIEMNFCITHPKEKPFEDYNYDELEKWSSYYWFQSVEVKEITAYLPREQVFGNKLWGNRFYEFSLDIFPSTVKIWCKRFQLNVISDNGQVKTELDSRLGSETICES